MTCVLKPCPAFPSAASLGFFDEEGEAEEPSLARTKAEGEVGEEEGTVIVLGWEDKREGGGGPYFLGLPRFLRTGSAGGDA